MVIDGKKIILRDYCKLDWERVHIYASIPSFTQYEPWGPNTIEETEEFIADMLVKQSRKPRFEFEFAIVLKDSNKLIGGCGFRKFDSNSHEGSIGYAVNPKYQGLGIATEATKLLLEFCFNDLDISLVYATCDSENIASYSVMKKCGMKKVLVCKDKRKFKGKIADEFRFEILKEEYIR